MQRSFLFDLWQFPFISVVQGTVPCLIESVEKGMKLWCHKGGEVEHKNLVSKLLRFIKLTLKIFYQFEKITKQRFRCLPFVVDFALTTEVFFFFFLFF